MDFDCFWLYAVLREGEGRNPCHQRPASPHAANTPSSRWIPAPPGREQSRFETDAMRFEAIWIDVMRCLMRFYVFYCCWCLCCNSFMFVNDLFCYIRTFFNAFIFCIHWVFGNIYLYLCKTITNINYTY